jgi:putative nucleotidyltransferase with HDIG domain
MRQAMLCLVKDPKNLPDLQPLRAEWDIAHALNTEHALQALAQKNFVAIVADAEMQGDTDLGFFTSVMNRFPKLLRILLFDPGDKKSNLKSNGSVHQFVTRPCTLDLLMSAIQRALLINTWLADPVMKQLFAKMRKLPSVPTIYFRLLQKLQSPETAIDDIGAIVAEDFVMTAKVLQMVNSPFFGLGRTITSPAEAVSYLGIERTKTLVLLAQAFSACDKDKSSAFSIDKLWQHCLATGNFARAIARQQSAETKVAEASFTAGLLHDVGKLMFAANLTPEYNEVIRLAKEKKITLAEAEWETFGTTHAELGACVLGVWGLPSDIVEALAFHHRPDLHPGKSFCPLTAVHVANGLEHELKPDPEMPVQSGIDLNYLARLEVFRQLEAWRDTCREQVEQALQRAA